jgi:FtsP/CotA-like multicopper oxidase with cupredoxin domain
MFGKTTVPQPYPSGLYWFHAHRHMFARNQVQGGDAGVLSVGNPLRVDYRDAQGKIVSQPLPPRTQVNYFALRDIQLAVPHGLRPVKATGQTAHWLNGENNLPDYDSTACEPKNSPWFSHGACGHDGLASGNSTDQSQDLVWLFTVNGQHFPQLTTAAGRPQLWRLANLSSNVTYVLEIAEGSDPKPDTPTLPFIAINLDGVVAGTPIENEPSELLGVSLKRLLLMPGSRAEIFLPSEACARVATLRTVGLQTGPGGNPAPTGDPWPQIDLARLRSTGTPGCPAPAVSLRELAAPVARPVGLDIRIPRREASLSGPAPGASAEVMLRASPSVGSATLAALHPGCRFLPEASAVTAYRRRITFEQGDDGFKLGSEVVDEGGIPFPGSPAIPPEIYPASLDWATTPHICPVLGAQEVWELVNNTDEMHNFHVHQSKFRLADAALDKGVPAGLSAVVAIGSGCATHPATAAFCDPLGVIGGVVPEAKGAIPTGVDAWHDTIPVPPRDGNGNAGRVFVSIPFKAPEQEGRFVFHCHILEHEDGGMMAPIEVLSTASITRQQQSEPMTTMSPMPQKH